MTSRMTTEQRIEAERLQEEDANRRREVEAEATKVEQERQLVAALARGGEPSRRAYFAEKSQPHKSRGSGYWNMFPAASGTSTKHEVLLDAKDGRTYWCKDCSFTTPNIAAARFDRDGIDRVPKASSGDALATAKSSPAVTNDFGFGHAQSLVPPTPAPAQTREFKTCPDCAEQIRFAARKCRFCGYMFEDVPAGARFAGYPRTSAESADLAGWSARVAAPRRDGVTRLAERSRTRWAGHCRTGWWALGDRGSRRNRPPLCRSAPSRGCMGCRVSDASP